MKNGSSIRNGAEESRGATFVRGMSAHDLATWGMSYVAYIKPVVIEGQQAFSIHAADGEQIGLAPGREIAQAAVRQHDMAPLSVH